MFLQHQVLLPSKPVFWRRTWAKVEANEGVLKSVFVWDFRGSLRHWLPSQKKALIFSSANQRCLFPGICLIQEDTPSEVSPSLQSAFIGLVTPRNWVQTWLWNSALNQAGEAWHLKVTSYCRDGVWCIGIRCRGIFWEKLSKAEAVNNPPANAGDTEDAG